MTVFMVTHDIREAFKLGTRVLVFDKVRRDPQAPAPTAPRSPTTCRSTAARRPRRGCCGRPTAATERPTRRQRMDDRSPRAPAGAPAQRRPARAAAGTTPISRSSETPGLEGARGRRQAAGGRLAQGAAMGARHGPARRREPDRPLDPDFRARRAAAFRRHQHVPQGALCRERPRRRQIRRGGDRHPVRFRHHLPPRHALRAAGHPAHLGALHALQLRARRRPARADDAVRRRRRVHDPGQPRKELRPDQPRRRACLLQRRPAGHARRRPFDRLSLRARHRRNAPRSGSASSISTATSTSRRRTSTSACTRRPGIGRPTCRTFPP